MSLDIRFAIASDLHIGLPHTIWDHPSRFHLVEVSIPALEQVLDHVSQLDIDFLLLPGDLTQHGERENHEWLSARLKQLPFPCYVIPGNHDVVVPEGDDTRIGSHEFAQLYEPFGYRRQNNGAGGQADPKQIWYSVSPVPGLRLIGLNSNQFDDDGKLIGRLDKAQLDWLEAELSQGQDEFDATWLMIHHNVLEHLPEQATHPMGRRYLLRNTERLKTILRCHNVQLIFTGHLHVQDVNQEAGLTEITTGSLVSYPHPYRVLHYKQSAAAETTLSFESFRIGSAPDWPELQQQSRDWMGDRSQPFMANLLSVSALELSEAQIAQLTPHLRYFWADIAQGDSDFNFEQFPQALQGYFKRFGTHQGKIDNAATLTL